MTQDQLTLFKHTVIRNAIGTFVIALMLLDNAFGEVAGILYSIYTAINWFTCVFTYAALKESVHAMRHRISIELIIACTLILIINVALLLLSPLNQIWMGALLGAHVIANILVAFRVIAEYKDTL